LEFKQSVGDGLQGGEIVVLCFSRKRRFGL
jgi:hypothetical protein